MNPAVSGNSILITPSLGKTSKPTLKLKVVILGLPATRISEFILAVAVTGITVGCCDGAALGAADGAALGAADGAALGKALGALEGASEGCTLGALDGASEGSADGETLFIGGERRGRRKRNSVSFVKDCWYTKGKLGKSRTFLL